MKLRKMLAGITAGAMILSLTVGGGVFAESDGGQSGLQDGTYTGTSAGHNGDITVSVEVKDGKLAQVSVTEHHETNGIGNKAMDTIVGCRFTCYRWIC